MRLPAATVLVLALACTPDPGTATFRYRESVGQIHVWKATPGDKLEVFQGETSVVTGVADAQGSFVFRKLVPGDGYIVRKGDEYTREMTVASIEGSAPSAASYAAQKLVPGFQYLKMRDGVVLSAYVTLPGPAEDGPYPTVVNYSGYAPSKPGGKIGDYELFCNDLPALCDAPNSEASLFAALMGYATVSVNMRGTGCSGGAYDYFETLQLLDGYDVIEIVAAQEWTAFHKVGMVGLSYPGITQLFIAHMKPPGLAAITPLSVIGNTATTLDPGGILNDGFALSWVTNVLDKAKPYGQGWEKDRVDGGDTICEENQLLHSQRVDNVEQARHIPFYVPEIVDPLNPEKWVGEIEVPVFLAGAWQDEQTGPYFGLLLDKFTKARALRMTVQNGVHVDQYAPAIFAEWTAFLDLFVAQKVPLIPKAARGLSPLLFKEIFKTSMSLPPDRFTKYDTYEAALAAWMAEPKLRVLFESGAGETPGAPQHRFEQSFERWPPPKQAAKRWYFEPEGTLGAAAPTAPNAASEFVHDPGAGQRGILGPRGDVWGLAPDFDWKQPKEASAVVFESAAIDAPLAMIGTGSVDLWIRPTATEADLEVNLSEVRSDGEEVYVQSGWLRASQRKVGGDATELYPAATHLEADAQPLVPGEWVQARVAIAPFSQVFHAGSKIRISVDTPGDSRAEWRFALKSVPEGSKIAIGHDATHASSIALPVVADVTVPEGLPGCTLRGQQCRKHKAFTNTPAVD